MRAVEIACYQKIDINGIYIEWSRILIQNLWQNAFIIVYDPEDFTNKPVVFHFFLWWSRPANTFFLCAGSANCRQTTSPYDSELTSILWPEQDWFCLVLGIPHWLYDQRPCLSYTYVQITEVYDVLREPPRFGGGGGGRGNSGAQAVLFPSALITSDCLGTRLGWG